MPREAGAAFASHLHPLALSSSNNNGSLDSFANPGDHVVVLVDPYSTGCVIAQEMSKRGYGLVAVWTLGFADEMKAHVPTSCGPMKYVAEVSQAAGATLDDVADEIRRAVAPRTVVGCIAGGEAGVDYADQLSENMGLLTNGTHIPNRRDKKVQQELIRRHGLRSVRQAGGDKLEDVLEFLKTEPYPLVLKPIESAGSDGVKLCYTEQEARDHFDVLMHSQMVNGGQCPAVVCQEFLRGTEYVVDHVSRDGRHVTTMVWVYDKRQVRRQMSMLDDRSLSQILTPVRSAPIGSSAGERIPIRVLWHETGRHQQPGSQGSHPLRAGGARCHGNQARALARRGHDDGGRSVPRGNELSRPRRGRELAAAVQGPNGRLLAGRSHRRRIP
jgi:hypothetical protein